ncbi:transcriptional regulatory protein FixJ [Terrihabitans soli]|uniref:Transcriptional regulatory protein FixJ n=1 Tax=Terrihabitans soli TaxID=708113 RepID=A0A6S6QP39_9HYPH|nr:response regulator FixJ [Terrihabitans soli]BCJ89677.1 transcriptional regulatory protein FixJ [Terrihabitans soli]
MAVDQLICVVDDDEPARKSLSFLLSTSGFWPASFESGPAFLDSKEFSQCRCVIADVRMPDMSGIELLRRAKTKRPDLCVVIITGHGDVPLAVEAMKAGAADFIEKPYDDERLLAAVNQALANTGSPEEHGRHDIVERYGRLSQREQEVMRSLVKGNPNKVIGHELGISARTVEIHRAHVMTKMQAKNLADLVRMSIAGGAALSGDS